MNMGDRIMIRGVDELRGTATYRKKPMSADSDVAKQVMLLMEVIARYGRELEEVLPGSSDGCPDPMRPGEYLLFNEAALVARLESAKRGTERLLENEINKARKAGAVRRMPMAPTTSALDALAEDFPHFGQVVDLLRQRAALAQVTPGRVYTVPPILLAGDAGVGKTAFGEALAKCLGLPTRRVDIASSTASFVLAGSHSSWSSARPGAVWALLHASDSSGVILIDEIDKAADSNHPPLGPLYTLLEPSSARNFMDEYVEVEINASNLFWIATCNDPGLVEPALRSRFQQFVIEVPSDAQMLAIAQSVYRQRRKNAAWGAVFPEQIDKCVAETMSACTPRELSTLIDAAAAHAASCQRTYIRPEDVAAAQKTQRHQGRQARRLGFL
jgi:ATP-dependent Lon protease